MNSKRLYRDQNNKVFAGVCSGLANYFDTDPTLIRILWVAFIILGGSGVLAYVLCCVLIPIDPGYYDTTFSNGNNYYNGNYNNYNNSNYNNSNYNNSNYNNSNYNNSNCNNYNNSNYNNGNYNNNNYNSEYNNNSNYNNYNNNDNYSN